MFVTHKGKHSARTFFLFLINYGDDVCIEDESEYKLQTIRKQDVRANPGKATPYNKNKECNSLAKIIERKKPSFFRAITTESSTGQT